MNLKTIVDKTIRRAIDEAVEELLRNNFSLPEDRLQQVWARSVHDTLQELHFCTCRNGTIECESGSFPVLSSQIPEHHPLAYTHFRNDWSYALMAFRQSINPQAKA